MDKVSKFAPSALKASVSEVDVTKFRGTTSITSNDHLATEEPLEIQLIYGPSDDRKTKSIAVTMRTPGHDVDLAIGFLLTEGVVRDIDHVVRVMTSAPQLEGAPYARDLDHTKPERLLKERVNIVRVELDESVHVTLGNLERNFYTTSSCGICGKASLLALRTVCPPKRVNSFSINLDVLYDLPERLRKHQEVFSLTGGLHGAGLFDHDGNLLAVREDVGRHNAVDKLVGSEFRADRAPLRNALLLLSGRASFELLQKALMAGIPMVAAVGAPSSMAVQVAKEFDISLVGFLRQNQFNIYHGAERIFTSVSAT